MQKIEMEKKLILVSDIDHIAALVGCIPTILVNESGEAFIDLVCKEQGVFYRVAKTGLKEERTFKTGTALNLLLKEGMPEVVTKVDRELLAPAWVHVEEKEVDIQERIEILEKRYMELASQMRQALNETPEGEPVEFPEGLHDEFQAVSNELRSLEQEG